MRLDVGSAGDKIWCECGCCLSSSVTHDLALVTCEHLHVLGIDVFVNVVGGVKVTETSIDLALILALVSSFRDKPLPQDLVVFGEIGLSGELRPVPSGQERINEAAKHGFTRAIVPFSNMPKDKIKGMTVIGVKKLSEALDVM